MYIVLARRFEEDGTVRGSLWESYEFHAQYRNQIHEGDTFVYSRVSHSRREDRRYFGTGVIGAVGQIGDNLYEAKLLSCKRFRETVPIYHGDSYVETLGYETVRESPVPPWQHSVRPLSEAACRYILQEAIELIDVASGAAAPPEPAPAEEPQPEETAAEEEAVTQEEPEDAPAEEFPQPEEPEAAEETAKAEGDAGGQPPGEEPAESGALETAEKEEPGAPTAARAGVRVRVLSEPLEEAPTADTAGEDGENAAPGASAVSGFSNLIGILAIILVFAVLVIVFVPVLWIRIPLVVIAAAFFAYYGLLLLKELK